MCTSMIRKSRALLAALPLAIVGCSDRDPASDAGSREILSPPATDRWLGRWTGPEGTFLLLEGGNGVYDVTIQNLDGPRRFRGAAAGDQIEFDRDGVQESLGATDGAGTGMKWLSDKSDCLTIRRGEGFCRD